MNGSQWAVFFLAGWGLPFTLYAIAQLVVPFRLRGRKRVWVCAPAPIMLWVLISAISSSRNPDANLWPIWLILLSPVALCILLLEARLPRQYSHGDGNAP
jgi:hypothetical protein